MPCLFRRRAFRAASCCCSRPTRRIKNWQEPARAAARQACLLQQQESANARREPSQKRRRGAAASGARPRSLGCARRGVRAGCGLRLCAQAAAQARVQVGVQSDAARRLGDAHVGRFVPARAATGRLVAAPRGPRALVASAAGGLAAGRLAGGRLAASVQGASARTLWKEGGRCGGAAGAPARGWRRRRCDARETQRVPGRPERRAARRAPKKGGQE